MKVKTRKPHYHHYHYSTCYWKTPKWFNRAIQKIIINPLWNSWWINMPTAKVKVDYFDIWNCDLTLAPIILAVLKKYRSSENKGAPFVDNEDVPEELYPPVDSKPFEADDNWHKRWDYVVNEVIWAFEQLVDDSWEDQYHTGELDFVTTPVSIDGEECEEEDAQFYRLDKGPKDTHEFDSDGYNAHSCRIANGLQLFGKYYRGFWI